MINSASSFQRADHIYWSNGLILFKMQSKQNIFKLKKNKNKNPPSPVTVHLGQTIPFSCDLDVNLNICTYNKDEVKLWRKARGNLPSQGRKIKSLAPKVVPQIALACPIF